MKNLIEILPNIYGVKVPIDFEYKLDLVYLFGLPSETYKPLGYVTATEISFDFEEMFALDWDAFRSVLENVGIYFKNPYEKPKNYDIIKPIIKTHFKHKAGKKKEKEIDYHNYQTANENITHKLLILQKL